MRKLVQQPGRVSRTPRTPRQVSKEPLPPFPPNRADLVEFLEGPETVPAAIVPPVEFMSPLTDPIVAWVQETKWINHNRVYGAFVHAEDGQAIQGFLARFPRLIMHLVDPWDDNALYMKCRTLLGKAAPRVVYHKGTSEEKAAGFGAGMLDFVVLGKAEGAQQVLIDLTAWLPRVHEGGFIAGPSLDSGDGSVRSAIMAFSVQNGLPVETKDDCWMLHKKAKE